MCPWCTSTIFWAIEVCFAQVFFPRGDPQTAPRGGIRQHEPALQILDVNLDRQVIEHGIQEIALLDQHLLRLLIVDFSLRKHLVPLTAKLLCADATHGNAQIGAVNGGPSPDAFLVCLCA